MSKKQSETIVVNEGEVIPFDGTVVEGTAFVDESAVAGVSKPVLIDDENGRNQVIAGGLITEGWLKIERTTDSRAPSWSPPDTPFSTCKSCDTECSTEKTAPEKGDPVLRWIFLVTLIIAATGICALVGYGLSSHSWFVAAVCGIVGLIIGISQGWRS